MKRVIAFIIIILLSLPLAACSRSFSRNEIIKLVTDNITLLEESIKVLKPLDGAIARISTTSKEPPAPSSGGKIEGLYCCVVTGDLYEKFLLDNKTLEKTMQLDGLLAINLTRRSEYVDFYCGLDGNGPDATYHGFYYSLDANPCFVGGDNATLEGGGGVWTWENNSGGAYTTKYIQDSWYFYEYQYK